MRRQMTYPGPPKGAFAGGLLPNGSVVAEGVETSVLEAECAGLTNTEGDLGGLSGAEGTSGLPGPVWVPFFLRFSTSVGERPYAEPEGAPSAGKHPYYGPLSGTSAGEHPSQARSEGRSPADDPLDDAQRPLRRPDQSLRPLPGLSPGETMY